MKAKTRHRISPSMPLFYFYPSPELPKATLIGAIRAMRRCGMNIYLYRDKRRMFIIQSPTLRLRGEKQIYPLEKKP